LNPKKSKALKNSPPESEPAAPESEDSEAAEEPDPEDDVVLAEGELVEETDFSSDDALEDAPMPVLVESGGGDA